MTAVKHESMRTIRGVLNKCSFQNWMLTDYLSNLNIKNIILTDSKLLLYISDVMLIIGIQRLNDKVKINLTKG